METLNLDIGVRSSAPLAALKGLLAALILGSACANATTYTLAKPDDTVVGEDQTIQTVYQDTLYDLARAYSLGSEELIRVNPSVDPWLPGAGSAVWRTWYSRLKSVSSVHSGRPELAGG